MVTKIFLFVFVLVPLTALISYRLAEALLWTGALLFAASTVKAIWKRRRDEPARKARLAAIIAAKPAYVVYGGGAPKWIAAPNFILFVAAAIALRLLREPVAGDVRNNHSPSAWLRSLL